MRILICGAAGNMGRRYTAILKNMRIEVIGFDIEESKYKDISKIDFDKAIIATPTETHHSYCREMIRLKKPFLCEKPISRRLERIKDILEGCKTNNVDGRMVCNWTFVHKENIYRPNFCHIDYNFYNTGKDGFHWDLIQLYYLSCEPSFFKKELPYFFAYIHPKKVTLDDICESYIRMISTWLNTPENLWDIEDALKATEKVLKYMEAKK